MSENKAETVIADDSGAIDAGASIERMMRKARLPRFSGAQMRDNLSTILPDIKRERKRRAKGAGRKHTYTRERFERLLARVANGETMQEAQISEGIAASTVRDWLERADGREEEALYCRQSLARARELHADHAFNEAIDGPRKLYALAMGNGAKDAPPLDSAMVGAVKLYSDTMRWYAGKLSPERYGDSKEQPVVNVTNNNLTISGRDLDAGQRDQLRALLTAAQQERDNIIEG